MEFQITIFCTISYTHLNDVCESNDFWFQVIFRSLHYLLVKTSTKMFLLTLWIHFTSSPKIQNLPVGRALFRKVVNALPITQRVVGNKA